jgi:hypothetical protein
MTIYVRGQWQEWARVASPQGGVARGGPAPPGGVAPLLLLSLSPFRYRCLLVIYEFLGISLELLIFTWCLDGPFSSRILTPAASSPMIIKHVKTDETT